MVKPSEASPTTPGCQGDQDSLEMRGEEPSYFHLTCRRSSFPLATSLFSTGMTMVLPLGGVGAATFMLEMTATTIKRVQVVCFQTATIVQARTSWKGVKTPISYSVELNLASISGCCNTKSSRCGTSDLIIYYPISIINQQYSFFFATYTFEQLRADFCSAVQLFLPGNIFLPSFTKLLVEDAALLETKLKEQKIN